MKLLLTIAAIVVGFTITFYTVLQNGSLIRYLDTHPNPNVVPVAEFYIGGGYYVWSSLQNAATCYIRVVERYPASSYAERAYFNYLQCLDDMNTPRQEMARKYETYLERYPKGEYIEIVQKRIEYCRNAR